METKTQLTEDNDLNNLTDEEKKTMLSFLTNVPYINSVSINEEDRKIFRDAARDAAFDALLGEGNWKLEKE